MTSPRPLVGICMGSTSDLKTMQGAADTLAEFGVPFEVRVLSAHRTPDAMVKYASAAVDEGLEVIVAGAGGAAHLPGMIAALTVLPVIGVPVATAQLGGLDSLLSIVQMPRGTPVATVAIGNSVNAAHLALRVLAGAHPEIRSALLEYQATRAAAVRADDETVRREVSRPTPSPAANESPERST